MHSLEIEEYIENKRKFWFRIIILGIFASLSIGIISFFYYWNKAIEEQEPPIFGPAEPIDLVLIIQTNYLLIVILPIVGSILLILGGQFGYKSQISKPITDLFHIYNIKQVKKMTGRIELTEQSYLEIIWMDAKKKFYIKKGSELIVYAKPANLFWKIMYLIHKYSEKY